MKSEKGYLLKSGVILGYGYKIVDTEFTFRDKEKEIVKPIPIILKDSYRKSHFWCFGTTRVGKTRSIENLIEQDIRRGNSIIVIDPKGDIELFNKVVQISIEENAFNDLFFINPLYAIYSGFFDPFFEYFIPEELAYHIVSGIEKGKEPFFYNMAYETSLLILQAMDLINKYKQQNKEKPIPITLERVKNFSDYKGLEKLKNELRMVSSEEAENIVAGIDKILATNMEHFSKITSSLRIVLTELTSGNIGRILSKKGSNKIIEKLKKGERVIAVIQLASLVAGKASYTLGKVILSTLQAFVGKVMSSGGKLNPPLAIYIDEAQNFLYNTIDEMFAKAGGADVWLHGYCQSINQIFDAVGEEKAKTILDNTNSKLFMRVPDNDTAKYLASFFGSVKKYTPMLGLGQDMKVTVREIEEDVLRATNLLELQPREFYYVSYNGKFRGKTLKVSDTYIDITYPDLSISKN